MKKYPMLNIATKNSYRRFFLYLCFSTFVQEKSGLLLIPHSTIAFLAGRRAMMQGKHFNAVEFLREFKLVVPDFCWLEPFFDFVNGKRVPRRVDVKFDKETTDMVNKEIILEDVKDREFISGRKWNQYTKQYVVEENIERHLITIKNVNLNLTQQIIFNYMEKVDGVGFVRKFNENKALIKEQILLLNEEKQKIQYRILASLKEDSKIHYYPGERTPRLSAAGDCIVGLKSSVRKALCHGWTEIDLKASQFAILAAKLNAPLSKKMIEDG